MRNYDYNDFDDAEAYWDELELDRHLDRRRTMMQRRGDAVVVRDPVMVTGTGLVLGIISMFVGMALLVAGVFVSIFLIPFVAVGVTVIVAVRVERAWSSRSAAIRRTEASTGEIKGTG